MTPSVTISARGEQRVRFGHPWIYRSDVVEVDAAGGDLVQVFGPRQRLVGHALFSDRSQIAIRMLSRGEHAVDESVVRGRLEGESESFAPGGAVWFQTRVLGGRAGESIRHVWSFNGRAEQSIVLRLGASDWRTHSNKTIFKVGAWTVEARDAEGNVLEAVAFQCEPGGR